MSVYTVKGPASLRGEVVLPASKSISNRLLILSALCGSGRVPDNLSDSDDTRVLLSALRSDLAHVDIGAAGTAMRFLTAYLATRPGVHVLTGSERMKKRPIGLLVDALRRLGASIEYLGEEGFPPLRIAGGGLSGGEISLPGNVSSQYVSALMMIGPTLRGGLRLTLEGDVVSVPYIEMTLSLMRRFGADVCWDGRAVAVAEGAYDYRQETVEADWSAASYWYAMAALRPGARVCLPGLLPPAGEGTPSSVQGDACGTYVARHLGVFSSWEDWGAIALSFRPVLPNLKITTVTGEGAEDAPRLPDDLPDGALFYDFVNQPDLAQTYVVLCCLMGRMFHFTGLRSLRIKETDRIAALVAEARKLGFCLEAVGDDCIRWVGATCQPSDEPIETYKDHRMAMSFAVASLARESVRIADPGVVSKSYPRFWDDLRSMGFTVEEEG